MELYKHCQVAVYSSQLNEYPKEVKEQYLAISELAQKLWKEFGEKLLIKVTDVASAAGVWKALRFGTRREPIFVANGKKKFVEIPSYDELRKSILEEASGVPNLN